MATLSRNLISQLSEIHEIHENKAMQKISWHTVHVYLFVNSLGCCAILFIIFSYALNIIDERALSLYSIHQPRQRNSSGSACIVFSLSYRSNMIH